MGENTRKGEVIGRLTDGIARLTTSERWHEWLKVASTFHHYSFNNQLLIQLQCPTGTRIAGFHTWRKLGRNVRKGEKGIWILAPMTYKVADNDEQDNGTEARVLRGFKPVPVFDIAQTDGEDLPEVCTKLDGDDDGNALAQLCTVADSLGFTVEDSDELPGAVNGDCSHDLHRIRVRSSNSPVQRVKTLAHELAHAILHEEYESRPLAELEAESVAFVVCHNLGITSDDYSFGYVAAWAGGGDEAQKAIKASGGRIQKAAEQILSTVEAESASLAA